MNTNLKTKQGNVQIVNGMINATTLCKINKKLLGTYIRSLRAKKVIEELSENTGLTEDELVVVNRLRPSENLPRGTWVHKDIAVNLAQWISKEAGEQVALQLGIKTSCQLVKKGDNSLVNCQLTLKDGTNMFIPMREDGYVNATLLCKAGGKQYFHWRETKQAEETIKVLQSVLGIPMAEIIQSISGGIPKYQGTYVHRRLALIIAQWISPHFAVQVSAWLEELLITGQVTLGEEKSPRQIQEEYETKIAHLQNTIENVTTENLVIRKTYKHLEKLHDSLKKKRNYHKFKKGNCVYIVSDRWREKDYLKIGQTDDIDERLQTYRTSMPKCKIEFLGYLSDNELLEKCLKSRYCDKLIEKNHEYIIDIDMESMTRCIRTLDDYLKLNIVYDNSLSLYNDPYSHEHPIEEKKENTLDEMIPKEEKEQKYIQETINSPQPNELFSCQHCEKIFKLQGNLDNHLKNMHNVNTSTVPDNTCPICKKIFVNKGKLNRHVKAVHEKATQVKCKVCNKNFSTSDSLLSHVKNVHTKETQSKCQLCDKICTTTGNLKSHIEQMHTDDNRTNCHICGKTLSNKTNLNQHIKNVHEQNETASCSVCNKVFASTKGLRHHRILIHKLL